MILPDVITSDYERFYEAFTEKYGDAIYALILKHTNEIELTGSSCKMFNIVQFRLAFLLGYLLYVDMQNTNNTWAYYESKYDLVNRRKYLACSGINLDDIYTIFGITPEDSEDTIGIGHMMISGTCAQDTFRIGGNTCTSSDIIDVVAMLALYSDGSICELPLDDC